MLRLMRKSILATDLVQFFQNRKALDTVVCNSTLNTTGNASHRDMVMSVTMTACDLGSAAKSWEIHRASTEIIFKEFYNQVLCEKGRLKDLLIS